MLTAWLAGLLDIGFHVDGFWTAVGGAIVITIVTWGVNYADRPRLMPAPATAAHARPLPRRAGLPRQHLPLPDGRTSCWSRGSTTPGSTTGSRSTSSGTGGWHVGNPMDRRAAATLTAAGYDATRHRARQYDASWADRSTWCWPWTTTTSPTSAASHRVRLFRDFDPVGTGGDVPDPYYGGDAGFEEVLTMVERTSATWSPLSQRDARPADDPTAAGRPARRGAAGLRRRRDRARSPAATCAWPPSCGSPTAPPR